MDEINGVGEARTRVNRLIGDIGVARRHGDGLQSKLDTRVKALNDKYEPLIKQHRDCEEALRDELIALVEVWGDRLFKRGTATIVVRNGEISRNRGPEKVVIDNDPAFVARARKLRLYKQLVKRKVTESPNKEALKKDRKLLKKFPGASIVREARWDIRPGRVKGQTISAPATPRVTD